MKKKESHGKIMPYMIQLKPTSCKHDLYFPTLITKTILMVYY